MNSDRLSEMIRQGGSVRERAHGFILRRYFYLVRQVGVRKLRLSYEEAAMAYSDALVELDAKLRAGEAVEDIGKMLYTLTYRRGVDMVRRRTTKNKVEPLSQPQNVSDLPHWLFEVLTYSEKISDLTAQEGEYEEETYRNRILACLKKVLDGMPPKRRALLMDKLEGYDYEELKQLHGFKTERVAHEMSPEGWKACAMP